MKTNKFLQIGVKIFKVFYSSNSKVNYVSILGTAMNLLSISNPVEVNLEVRLRYFGAQRHHPLICQKNLTRKTSLKKLGEKNITQMIMNQIYL